MSTLVGHFVLSPREREKRGRIISRGDEREGQGRNKNRNESEETEEIKKFPLLPSTLTCYKDKNVKRQYTVTTMLQPDNCQKLTKFAH